MSESTQYFRTFGRHDIELSGGEHLSILSAEDWDAYWSLVSSAENFGSLALGPEVITAPPNLNDIPAQQDLQITRVADMHVLSRDHPHTIFAFGSATFAHPDKPRNSLLFVHQGMLVGSVDKTYAHSMNEEELRAVQMSGRPTDLSELMPGIRLSAMVCSDIIGEISSERERKFMTNAPEIPRTLVLPATDTLLISALWANPLYEAPPSARLSTEDRFRLQLEECVELLFVQHPNIKDIVVADRSKLAGLEGPLNAHFSKPD